MTDILSVAKYLPECDYDVYVLSASNAIRDDWR